MHMISHAPNHPADEEHTPMPLWLILTLIGVVWVATVAVIILFMMGASRGRRLEREAMETSDLIARATAASAEPDLLTRTKDV